jgi:hypothetical protein
MSLQAPRPMTVQEIAGERRLRQLLFVLDLLAFLGIGAAALYIWRFWPRGQDVYSDLQQHASETYLFVWMGVALAGAITALSRKTRMISFALSFLLLLECLAQLYFFNANHRPYHPWARGILDRFEPHPIFVGIPHPGQYGGLSNDNMHRRTTINADKAADARLIYVFGGSSTYDVGVVDSETWASNLSRLLGPHYEIQNYGVPGFTTMEAMLQALFAFRDVKPLCAIYYEGWNDLYVAHVDDLTSDYFPMQQSRLLNSLALGHRPGPVSNYWLFLQLIDRAIQQGSGYPDVSGTVSGEEDLRLSKIYTENIGLITDIDRHFGVPAIFVPQVLNYDLIESHYGGWWPYIPGKAVKPLVQKFNSDMRQTAEKSGALFLAAPLGIAWNPSDFVDQGHFSAAGAAKFAQAIAPGIAANCK